jgi:hypothetical protein
MPRTTVSMIVKNKDVIKSANVVKGWNQLPNKDQEIFGQIFSKHPSWWSSTRSK